MKKYEGQTVKIGKGFSVQFKFNGKALDCEWSPCRPPYPDPEIMSAYRCARDRFIGELQDNLGVNAVVVEI